MPNEPEVLALVETVKPFFPEIQLQVVLEHISDSKHPDWLSTRAHYIGVLQSFKETFARIPKLYETEPEAPKEDEADDKDAVSKSGEAIAYLHYFIGRCDWWITEKESESELVYGVTDLGYGPEFGYISLVELLEVRVKSPSGFMLGVELDFHWEPKPLKDIPELKEMFRKLSD